MENFRVKLLNLSHLQFFICKVFSNSLEENAYILYGTLNLVSEFLWFIIVIPIFIFTLITKKLEREQKEVHSNRGESGYLLRLEENLIFKFGLSYRRVWLDSWQSSGLNIFYKGCQCGKKIGANKETVNGLKCHMCFCRIRAFVF